MSNPHDARFTLIGGGLGGALLAAYLGRAGYRVELYERRPDPRAGTIVGGRSINLAISVRGLHALGEVGLADEVLRMAVPMRGRMIHTRGGDLHYQPYDKDPSRCINSVSRGGLNALTLEAAQKHANVRVHFDHRCVDVDLDRPRAELVRPDGAATSAESDVLIGIDGAFSAVRRAMQRTDRFNFSQTYLEHGYKELTIPPAEGGGFRMEPHALHIWPRRSFMMIALPNPDGSFTCTLFLHFGGGAGERRGAADGGGFSALRTRDDAQRFFEQQFADALPLMPTLLDDFERNPTGAMATMRCSPWHVGGKVALVGDAAHAVVPFYGQGANASFEDCAVLGACLQQHAPDWGRALAAYSAARQPHADALADLALMNFIEMRDKTARTSFRAYKKMDRLLHAGLPAVYSPLYTLVSFSRTPYGDARRIARRQDRGIAVVGAVAAIVALALLGRFAFGGSWVEALATAALLVLVIAAACRAALARDNAELRRIGVREL